MPGSRPSSARMAMLSREARAPANQRLPAALPKSEHYRGIGLSLGRRYFKARDKRVAEAENVVRSSPAVSSRSSSSSDDDLLGAKMRDRRWAMSPRQDTLTSSLTSGNDRFGISSKAGHTVTSLWDAIDADFPGGRNIHPLNTSRDGWNGLIDTPQSSRMQPPIVDAQVSCNGGSSPSSPPRETCRSVLRESIDNSCEAVCDVIHEMLQMKYGIVLDLSDMLRKIQSKCVRHFREGCEYLTPPAVVSRLNELTSLQFRTSDGHSLVSIRAECRNLSSFSQLLREVRKLHGTARIVAVVSGLGGAHHSSGLWPLSISRSPTALAAFREDYAQSDALVGRRIVNGNSPLFTFDSSHFCEAFVLDPEVRHIFSFATGSNELLEKSPPPLREEYRNLRSRLTPNQKATMNGECKDPNGAAPEPEDSFFYIASSDAKVQPPGTDKTRTAPNSPMPPPPPTPKFMADLRSVLEDPHGAARGERQSFEMMQQLSSWLDKDPSAGRHTVNEACKALDTAGLQHGLAACIKRAAAPGNCSRHDLSMGLQAARSTGLAIRNSTLSPQFINKFSAAGCVPALCDLLERWPDHEETQRNAVFALRHIVEDEDAAIEALFIGAARVLSAAAQRLPDIVDLQANSSQAIQIMTLRRKAWIEKQEEQRSEGASPMLQTHSPRLLDHPPPWQRQAPPVLPVAFPPTPTLSFPTHAFGFAPVPLASPLQFAPPLVPTLLSSHRALPGQEISSHAGFLWR